MKGEDHFHVTAGAKVLQYFLNLLMKLEINLQLRGGRYKRALGQASHAFLLLQNDLQSPQYVSVCP